MLDSDPTESYRVEIQNVVEDIYQEGEIKESVKKYLTEKSCKTSRFYVLPKIHKGIRPPPGRPVVSANGCRTEKISKFVDHFLNPTCRRVLPGDDTCRPVPPPSPAEALGTRQSAVFLSRPRGGYGRYAPMHVRVPGACAAYVPGCRRFFTQR